MLRWPTSELPICPPGRPTARSEASIVVCGHDARSRSQLDFVASAIALSGGGAPLTRPERRDARWGALSFYLCHFDPAPLMSLSFVQTNWMLILVFLLSGGVRLWPRGQRRFGAVKDVGTPEVTRLINRENAVLLDVREAKEYEGGRLPNAIHIPLSQLGSRAQELAKMASRPIVAYCATGR